MDRKCAVGTDTERAIHALSIFVVFKIVYLKLNKDRYDLHQDHFSKLRKFFWVKCFILCLRNGLILNRALVFAEIGHEI